MKERAKYLIFLSALFLHIWKIGGDLPNLYYPDEPHHLNVAANFGTGDLNPHDFKYPTFWSYVIALLFGVMYVLAQILGLINTTSEFAIHYLYSPGFFYLPTRLLAALLTSASTLIFYQYGKRYYDRSFAITISLLWAVSPLLNEYGRDATLYGLFIFLIALALFKLERITQEGDQRGYILGGFFLGLAMSTQYIAAPLGSLLFVFHWLNPNKEKKWTYLLLGVAFTVLGFFVGSPYILLDFSTFKGTFFEYHRLQHGATYNESVFSIKRMGGIGKNVVQFLDPWGIGFACVVLGLIMKPKQGRWEHIKWMVPLLITLPILGVSHYGGGSRYALAVFLPLIIPAAAGLKTLCDYTDKIPRGRWLLLLIALSPMAVNAIATISPLGLPDTRTLAKKWIETNVPTGDAVFLSEAYHCPQLLMHKSQVEELLTKTRQINHPRRHYYQILLDGHKGGGYQIYYWKRAVPAVMDIIQRTEESYKAQPLLDPLSEGFNGFLNKKIEWVILDDDSINFNETWMREIEANYEPVALFEPLPQKTKGPLVKILTLKTGQISRDGKVGIIN